MPVFGTVGTTTVMQCLVLVQTVHESWWKKKITEIYLEQARG